MYYAYILYSLKYKRNYYGSTKNLQKRLEFHNAGKVFSTKPYLPWQLIWYGGFIDEKRAKDFERYLKTGSGKAFAYKRLIDSVALKKDD